MQLSDLSFAHMAPSWEGAALGAAAWLPELSGSVEGRAVQADARILLAALFLSAALRAPQSSVADVADLLFEGRAAIQASLSALAADDNRARAFAAMTPAVLQLLRGHLADWRVRSVARDWPGSAKCWWRLPAMTAE